MSDGELDARVRSAIAASIRGQGAIPTIADVAAALGQAPAAIDASFARMIDQHVFIPRVGSHEIHAYDPFCADPTDFRVQADGRQWWAICGWDALGVPPALGTSGTLEAHCGDCGDPIRIEVGPDGQATGPSGTVLQVGVPAREFWKDIYVT